MVVRRRAGLTGGSHVARGLAAVAVLELLWAGAAGGETNATCPRHDLLFEASWEAPAVCTTTTITSTVTSTTTTTPNTTTSTTTTMQPRECRAYCQDNGHPWFVKCSWPTCATCMDCNNVVVPGDPQQGGGAQAPTTVPSNSTTMLWGSTTTAAGDDVPAPAPVATEAPTVLPWTTTTHKLSPVTCVSGCRGFTQSWTVLCTWATCSQCSECFPTTTTTTTTTSSTTNTSTHTTSLTTSTTTTTTTSTDEPSTSTTTVTISTTPSTTGTTTTTTTTGVPCRPPPRSVYPIVGCQQNITAGSECRTQTLPTPCMEQSELIFGCPVDNQLHDEPVLLSGSYAVRCRICGMVPTELEDLDGREGYVSASVEFGPNAVDGAVNESGITGYFVFMVDECSQKVGEALATVEVGDEVYGSCCNHDTYRVQVTVELPVNITNLSLMIVPNTTAGMLTAGTLTDAIADRVFTATSASNQTIGHLNGAHRGGASTGLAWALAAAGVLGAMLPALDGEMLWPSQQLGAPIAAAKL